MAGNDTPGLHYDVLGALRVHDDGREIRVTRPGYRRTLSWLLLDAGRPVDGDVLIERLWPDGVPPTARNTLQHYVGGLRRVLGRDAIRTVGHGYEVDVEHAVIDVTEFDALGDLAFRASRDEHVGRAISLADSALGLWRGPPFEDLDGHDHVLPEVRRLLRVRQQIEEARLASLIDLGHAERAIPDLEALVLADPLRERLWELLMTARYRSGEQAGALRAFQEARRHLVEQVGLEPGPGLRRAEQQILRHDPVLTDVVLPRRTNLPPAESQLMGRSLDLATLRELTASSPVVTITGPPGMGKTHLAAETARSLLEEHEDGVWLVSLRSESTMQDVTRAFAAGVESDTGGDLKSLVTHLRHLDVLVVVDNAEHVIPECRRVMAEALKGAEGLRFLVTSRAPIGISGEAVWRLRGLDTATGDPTALSPAAELLAWRVQMIEASFRVTTTIAPKLNAIAARADGVPLAMVLMESWLPAVGLDEVVDLLAAPSNLVTNGNGPETIEDALEWSYRLLSPSDVDHFNSLAVFVSSFDLDAGHAVAGPDLDRRAMIGVMARLVEASLLETIRANDGSLRYRMLLPIRDHAVRRLEGSDRRLRVREAHRSVFRARALEFARSGIQTSAALLRRIDRDIGDYRAAMQWALDDAKPEATADIAAGLTEFWFARFLSPEGRDWLERAARDLNHGLSAFHLAAAGFLSYLEGEHAVARSYFIRSLETSESSGDDETRARALFGLGRVQLFQADSVEGIDRIEEAIRMWADDPSTLRLRTEAHLMLGMRATRLGSPDDPHLVTAARLLEELDDPSLVSSLRRYESLAAWNREDFDSARTLAVMSVEAAREVRDAPKLCGALSQLALAHNSSGDDVAAAAAMLEALDIVEKGNLDDVAQVLSGGIGLLISTGHRSEALDTLALLDEQYERNGVGDADFDLAATRRWRRELDGVDGGSRSGTELVGHVRNLLGDIVALRASTVARSAE